MTVVWICSYMAIVNTAKSHNHQKEPAKSLMTLVKIKLLEVSTQFLLDLFLKNIGCILFCL